MAFLRLSHTMVAAVAALAMLMAVRGTLGDGECNTTILCSPGFCCSKHGYCGTDSNYCAPGNCASQCPESPPPTPDTPTAPPPPPPPPSPPHSGGTVGDIITSEVFEQMLPRRNTADCHAVNFYTYSAFIEAAKSFPEFGTTGNTDTNKRELAAFFGQTSHETTGNWATAPEPYTWGYCYKEEINKADYCSASVECPCEPGKQYYGRGPMQLSHNYNYCQCGKDLGMGLSLLQNPEQVSEDVLIAFKAAIWFWMTPQAPKPSCHDVMVGLWVPNSADIAANRLPGFGVTTNIINGGLECGIGEDSRQEDRIGYYKHYCDMLGVSYGDNLDCNSQGHFGLAMNLRSGASTAVSEALVA